MLRDIKEKIKEIRSSDFGIEDCYLFKVSNLLRSVLICYNAINSLENHLYEKKLLFEKLDGVMKNKFKKLNSNFSDEVLDNMISGNKKCYLKYPIDILVVDDVVFYKEGVFDDFFEIYKIITIMLGGINSYYNVFDGQLKLDNYDFLSSQNKESLTKEDSMYVLKFISGIINSIYNDEIKSRYELDTNTIFYETDGIVSGEVCGVNAYINMNFVDIDKNLKSGNECDFKIFIQNNDDLILYYVHQSFKNNKPVWKAVKTNSDVWRLTEEALKLENESSNVLNNLVRKRER